MSPWSVGVNVTKQEGNKETSKLRVFSVYSVFYAYGQRIFYAYASAYDVRRPTTATFYKCSSLPTSLNPSHLPPPKTNSLHAPSFSLLHRPLHNLRRRHLSLRHKHWLFSISGGASILNKSFLLSVV